jgi:hypothetical protein
MNENLIPSIIQSGSGLAGSIIDYFANKDLQKNAFILNQQQSEYAYGKELEMWNKANAYNSPAQQMQRLQDAGLNPNLVYGNGVAQSTAATLPKYQPARYDAPTYKSGLGETAGMALSQYNDMRRTNAQVDLVKTQQDLNVIKAATGELDNKQKKALNPIQLDVARQTLENLKSTGQLQGADLAIKNLQKFMAEKDKELYEKYGIRGNSWWTPAINALERLKSLFRNDDPGVSYEEYRKKHPSDGNMPSGVFTYPRDYKGF